MPLDPELVKRMKRDKHEGALVPVGQPYDGGHETYAEREQRMGKEEMLLQRQFDVYELRCTGATLREIGALMDISYQTVVNDIAAEAARRTEALVAGSQDIKVAMSVSRYEGVIMRTLNRMARDEAFRIQRGIPTPNKSAFLDEKVIIEAQQRIDHVQGLLRVAPASKGDGAPVSDASNAILETFVNAPADTRLALLKLVRERKTVKVTPEGEEATG